MQKMLVHRRSVREHYPKRTYTTTGPQAIKTAFKGY